MNDKLVDDWSPENVSNEKGDRRRVGVEIELAGLACALLAERTQKHFGGKIEQVNQAESFVRESECGDFKIELDASYLKALAEKQLQDQGEENSFSNMAIDILTKAAEYVVPWELVTPPMSFDQLDTLSKLVADLRSLGALGTRHAVYFAFGVHFNPELPNLEADTIVRYLKAYFCLYDWIVEQDRIDTARKLTPYIRHFSKDYIRLVIDPNYHPDMNTLIDDYLLANPTRNRSLDMLPLFKHIDEERVLAAVDDPRINARPTFHYRLPNCDIDNKDWNIHVPWRLWLEVEKLAWHEEALATVSQTYSDKLSSLTFPFDSSWVKEIDKFRGAW